MPKPATFISIAAALGALLVLILLLTNYSAPEVGAEPEAGAEPQACNMDAKICPDGSSVGRTGPNCEFAACPSPERTEATLTTYVGGTVTAMNVTLEARQFISDSRCPQGVQCIWAGTVEVRTVMSTPVAHGEHVLKLGEPQQFGEYTVTLTDVTPYPKQGQAIPESSYRFTYTIKKGEAACPAGTTRVGEGCMPLKDECENRGDGFHFNESTQKCVAN